MRFCISRGFPRWLDAGDRCVWRPRQCGARSDRRLTDSTTTSLSWMPIAHITSGAAWPDRTDVQRVWKGGMAGAGPSEPMAARRDHCEFIQCGDVRKLDWGFCSSRALCVDSRRGGHMALDAQEAARHQQ